MVRRNRWTLVKVVAAVYAALVIFHAVTSGSLSLGYQMTASDIRVASFESLRMAVGEATSFVTRSQGESALLALGSALAFGTAEDPSTVPRMTEAICVEGWPEVLG